MSISKKIYNDLINNEIYVFFNKQTFYFIQDNLSCVFNNGNSLTNKSKKLVQKFVVKKKKISNFVNVTNLKFPIFVIFIKDCFFLDQLFFNFFSNNSDILFLKYKNQLFNSFKIRYKSIFNGTLNQNKIEKFRVYSIKIILYNFYLSKKKDSLQKM